MLLVKTKIGPSDIAGIGLFADEFIKEGTVVWEYHPKLDQTFSKEEVEQFPDCVKEQFFNYAYLDKNYGKYLLCGDDARFFNHSDSPNCRDSVVPPPKKDVTVALCDIQIGEEMTCNYKDFYQDISDHHEIE